MLLSYYTAERYKINPVTMGLTLGLFTAGPFLATLFTVLTKRELIATEVLSLDMISRNVYGAWSSLLYPLLCIILVQSVTATEHETNNLRYHKSTAVRWGRFFIAKCAFVLTWLTVASLLNIVTTTVLFAYIARLQATQSNVAEILNGAGTTFLGMTAYCLPLLAFQLLLSLLIDKSYLSFAIGLVLLVIGIPIVNLTDFIYNPYALLIAAEKYGYLDPSLIGYAALLNCVTPVVFYWRINR